MSWFPNGDYYQFTEASINGRAPVASGVYGIYNHRHQILIGATPNIRATLLQLRAENKFRLQRFRPTGFTFEQWSPQLREQRARSLIAEYRPILNNSSALSLTPLWRSLNYQGASAFHPPAAKNATPKLLPAPGEQLPITRRPKPVRLNFAAWAGSAAVLALIVGGYFSWRALSPMMNASQSNPKVAVEKRTAAAPSEPLPVVREAHARESIDTPATGAEKDSGKTPGAMATAASKTPPPAAPAKSASNETPPQDQRLHDAKSQARSATDPPTQKMKPASKIQNRWTVQVRATPDRVEATSIRDRLKGHGYDAFLNEAEIKGRVWYRVRVGNFATQPQAESLQKQLQTEEGLRDAFIVNRAKESVVLAKRGDDPSTGSASARP